MYIYVIYIYINTYICKYLQLESIAINFLQTSRYATENSCQ